MRGSARRGGRPPGCGEEDRSVVSEVRRPGALRCAGDVVSWRPVSGAERDGPFAGSIPEPYQTRIVPLPFARYTADLAARPFSTNAA